MALYSIYFVMYNYVHKKWKWLPRSWPYGRNRPDPWNSRGIPAELLTQFSHTGTVNVSGKIPAISGRFRSILAAGYGHGISAANSCHFPSGSGRKLGVSGEFPGGILRQESSSWVIIISINFRYILSYFL